MKNDKNENAFANVYEIMENIAHQWRQPLAQINATVGMIDNILYKKDIHDPDLEEKLKEIEKLTKYMSNTIEDFKLQFDNKETQEAFKLDTLLEDSIAVVSQNFKDNEIEIVQNYEKDLYLHYPQNKLKQIIIVLLNNSKDALLTRNTFGAKVEITLAKIDEKYLISINDNAGGITKSVMEKMFEPYYTTKHSSEGSGIGLYLAKKIIEENYQGRLEVKNQGKGSCFTIELPSKA